MVDRKASASMSYQTKALIAEAQASVNQGELVKASDLFQKALEISPENVTALMGLGQTYFRTKTFQQAKTSFNKVLNLRPEHSQAYYGLGMIAQHLGDIPSAISSFRKSIIANPATEDAYIRLAQLLHQNGESFEALKTLEAAQSQFPEDLDFTFMRGKLATSIAPSWHLPMLADAKRNAAYERAIKAVVSPDDIVLDIGTGSGILAMMAARSGAKHVYAVESNTILASSAREIITLNGYEDQVSIIEKHSSQIIIGRDMPEKADVLVTEIFDNAMIGEGILPTISHAWKQLLKLNARVIPKRGIIYGALCSCPSLEMFHHAADVSGFDLSPMRLMAHPLSYTDAEARFDRTPGNIIMSAPFEIKNFDFQREPKLSFSSTINIDVLETGRANAVLLWFDIKLAEGVIFSTQSTEAEQHWRQVNQLLISPRDVSKGQRLKLNVGFNKYFQFNLNVKNKADV